MVNSTSTNLEQQSVLQGWHPRGGGQMGISIRAFDWSATSIGPLADWPINLRIAVELCLNSRFPMLAWWGTDLINIYNDAYAPILGSRHPHALGRPARELWQEIWTDIGPQTEAVLLRGESTWNHRAPLMLERNGYPEECWFTFSYSPIFDESGKVGGLFCAVTEETSLVLAERQRDQYAEKYALQSRRFEQMLSSITDHAYVFDLEGRFLFANRPLLALLGKTSDEVVGKDFSELAYPPELSARLSRQIQQVITTGLVVMDETAFTGANGVVGSYEYILSPVIGADGKVEAVAGVTRELTERKRLESEREKLGRAVERERANLAAIIEQSPSFIAVLRGPEHVYELVNERYNEIAGRRDLIGKTVRQAFPDIAGQGYYELLDEVYRTGKTFAGNEMPVLLRQDDGSFDKRYVNLIYQVLRDSDSRASGIFAHGIDITEMVVSREALKQNEEFHRFAAEAGRTGSWNARVDTMETTFSPMMCQLVGLPAIQTTLSFSEWFKFVLPEHRAGMEAAVSAAVGTDVPYDYEFEVRRTDGVHRWLASRGGVIRDSDGKAIRLHGATVDITDRRRLAEERERLLESERAARADAEHASKAKDKFLAVLSHELRTPLSPVVMTIPSLEKDPDLPEKFREDLAMVRRNIDLEVKLIDDLLDLSRVTSGKIRLNMDSVQAHELLGHMIHSSQADVQAKRLKIVLQLQATNHRLQADPARLQQVFWNLLRNAIKFTPEDGQIIVRSFNSADGSELLVEIEDTGVGIAPEILPRVFDAFEQGDARTTRQFGGLGLGLAISKAVVDMHGGTITALSDGQDQGATFQVRLNTAVNNTRTEDLQPMQIRTQKTAAGLVRVLLVEDHPDTSRTMSRLLKNFGFAVSTAHSVTNALQILDSEKFDVMISDIGLPDATGYELMQEAKIRHGLKGIALSGYGMEEDIRKSRDAGFSEHLVKPISIAQLKEVLAKIIEA